MPLLKDENYVIRARAAYVIGDSGDDKHVDALKQLLKDVHEGCQHIARLALDQLQRKGPLALALEETGDITAALKKVAKDVETDADGNVISVDLTQFDTPHRLVRSDYRLLAQLKKLQSLKLTYSNITAAELTALKDLPLRKLWLDYCPRITDVAAETIATLKMLEVLELPKTHVADKTAAAISKLTQLRVLNLDEMRESRY